MTRCSLAGCKDGRNVARRCLTCRRSALPGYTVCGGCLDRLLAQAFGTPEKEYHVERLSAADPELAIKGRRVA